MRAARKTGRTQHREDTHAPARTALWLGDGASKQRRTTKSCLLHVATQGCGSRAIGARAAATREPACKIQPCCFGGATSIAIAIPERVNAWNARDSGCSGALLKASASRRARRPRCPCARPVAARDQPSARAVCPALAYHPQAHLSPTLCSLRAFSPQQALPAASNPETLNRPSQNTPPSISSTPERDTPFLFL